MYAEQFKILNPSPLVEAAAKWVQWAMTGLMAGGSKEAEVRYNLDQFWKVKAARYSEGTPVDRANLERLDVWAHGLWDALESAKITTSAPDYWAFWKASILGGVPPREAAVKAAEAATRAIAGQRAAAARASALPGQEAFGAAMLDYAGRRAENLPRDVKGADTLWTQAGQDILGVPLWAWGAGLGLLGILFLTRR